MSEPDPLVPLARRRRGQAPPPWVVWEALESPFRPDIRAWFDVRPGEVAPRIVRARRPSTVMWTSIWADRPDLRIEFEIEPDDGGSMVTWTLMGPDQLDADDVRQRRYRVNQLINGQLRSAFDN